MDRSDTQLNARKIKKATLSATVQQPTAVYPTSLGVLAGTYLLAFGVSPVALGLCVGGLAIGAGGWLFEYFVRGDRHALAIVNEVRRQLAEKRRAAIAKIETELQLLKHQDGLRQLQQLTQKFDNFEQVLGKKLDSGEITYNRYLAMAEQVFLNALDNLEQLAFALQSVAAINMELIQQRLRQLPAGDEQIGVLQARVDLWQEQQTLSRALLLENERAMTQLDRVSARLAQVRTKESEAVMDMENAMSELESLINKAKQYERK